MKFLSVCLVLWLALWPAIGPAGQPAHAESLSVGDLRLAPGPDWRRGTPQQEAEDDALQLSWAGPEGISLQVLVPRNTPLIKSDADTFYRNLARKWSAQYGKEVAIGWIDPGEKGASAPRWLSCRRAASSGDGTVFHLATVHEGRAYSLLAFAPPGTEALPPAVFALAAAAGFDAMPIVLRGVQVQPLWPRGDVLDALAQAESDALGDQGMLTGYGVRAEPDGESAAPGHGGRLTWFLEGFRWDKGYGRDERLPFEVRGRLEAEAPPLLDGSPLRVTMKLEGTGASMEAQVSTLAYCGPPGPWSEAMEALARGARGPMVRLVQGSACAEGLGSGQPETLRGEPGQAVERAVSLAPPPARVNRLLVEIKLLPEAGSIGEGILGRLAFYFVYAP